ncbi:MAG: cytochrome c [Bacteroidota bacterium]
MPKIIYLLSFLSFLLLSFYFSVVIRGMLSSPDFIVLPPSENAYSPKSTVPNRSSKPKYSNAQLPGLPQGANLAYGEKLFNANCASCHMTSRNLLGPALGGAWAKYRDDRDFLYAWVRNAPKLIEEGNPKAVVLSAWGVGKMLAFPTLTDAQIASILAYAEAESSQIALAPTIIASD